MNVKAKISEKPILFSGPMVRAILDGRKTMTRRVIKCHCNTGHITGNLLGEWGLSVPPHQWNGDVDEINWRWRGEKPQIGDWIEQFQTDVDDHDSTIVRCPYGKPGDRLWVRETFSEIPDQKPSGYFTDPKWINRKYWYAADNDKPTWGGKWKPSIFMPRDAYRILADHLTHMLLDPLASRRIDLEITDIRVERLQEISEADARAEGFPLPDGMPGTLTRTDLNGQSTTEPATHYVFDPVLGFRMLWDGLNKETGFGWDANPFVWVVAFKKLEAQ